MEEIWKDIQGYEGFYQVSSLGRVRSLARTIKTGANCNHPYQALKEKFLHIGNCGNYASVILSKNGKTKYKSVHRLVAQAFIPNPNNLPCVNHKDENRRNNNVDNLEWCSYSYNNSYNGRIEKCKDKIRDTLKSRKRNKPLTSEQREHIRQAAIKGWEKRRARSAITEKEAV